MRCPRCKTPELKPTMIEEYLPAMGCGTCEGSLVSLLYYRHWAETQKAPPPESDAAPGAVDAVDTTVAMTCPKCSRIMTKYKLSCGVANRLDVCPVCDEAWLDRGEWALLEAMQLSHRMPAIFTEQWQRRIRRESSEETRRSILKRMIGEEACERVDAFRAWLQDHARRSDIMSYLYRK
jgi:Zn-finger nucleic acid-binding protein